MSEPGVQVSDQSNEASPLVNSRPEPTPFSLSPDVVEGPTPHECEIVRQSSSVPVDSTILDQPLRQRPVRSRKPPDRYGQWVYQLSTCLKPPHVYETEQAEYFV